MRYDQYHDFDAFAESIRDVDARMVLVNPQRHLWTSSALQLQGIDLQIGWLGSGNLAQAGLRDDFYLFYLPTTPGIEYKANGIVLQRNAFAVVKPGSEFCIATKDPHNWFGAFVPKKSLGPLPDDMANSRSPSCWMSRTDDQAASRFRTLVYQVMKMATTCSDFESTAAAKVAAKELVEIAKSAFEQPVIDRNHRGGRPKVPREQVIDTCMDFIEQCTDTHIQVSELARTADVSERTIRSAFNEYFGVGPIRYLYLRRLQEIHRDLDTSEPDGTTVSNVLADHGEWDFGRFASNYRQLFGELPSETLRRKKSAVTPCKTQPA